MTTRGEINSNFYQIVNVDGNGAPTSVKGQYITSGNVDNALHANVADVANSVSVGNVTGIGNIATTNYDGNASNILYGNGGFFALPVISNVGNANFANFAGTAFNVSGSNVSGEVANANYASYANIAASANSVAVANVVGIGNIATINLDGSSSNVLFGNGVFAPESTSIANANYANFAGNVVNNSQPNITTVGNLTSLSVTGNSTFGNTIILSSSSNPDISGTNNSSNAQQRGIQIISGLATSPELGNGNAAGSVTLSAGGAFANADPGSRWNATSGSLFLIANTALSANGNATSGAISFIGGNASSNLFAAITGAMALTTGSAVGANGNATTGTITIGTGRANTTTTGTATSGSINIQIGQANGASGNVIGNINIGSQPNNATIASPTAINIGQATTPTNVGGNLVVSGVISGNGSGISSISGANVSGEVANANYANFANIASTANSATRVFTTSQAGTGYLLATTVTSGNANVGIASTGIGYSGGTVSAGAFQSNNLTGTAPLFVSSTTLVPNLHVARANVADTANSVAVANVVGIGNIATINLDGSSSNVLYGNGVFAPESTTIANANYANFAGNVVNSSQPNITTVGNLTSLSVVGNSTFGNTIILSSNSNPDISGTNNSSNATQRGIQIISGLATSPELGNGNAAGSVTLSAGGAFANADPGSRWNATSGSLFLLANTAVSANGNATSGTVNLTGGNASSNLFAANTGAMTLSTGFAVGANGNATTGAITFTTGRANTTTTGTATSGNINFQIGQANGVSGNTIGNINIGSQAANGQISAPTAINIGQATTPTNIGGNANVAGNLTSGNANLGNLAIANFFSGNGSLLTGITSTNANFANFAGNVTVSSQPNITSVGNTLSSGQLTLNTTGAGAPSVTLNGIAGSSNGLIDLRQGSFVVTNTDLSGGQAPFSFNTYGTSAYQEPMNYLRARGTPGSPANCIAGDTVLNQRWQAYANNTGTNDLFTVGVAYSGFTTGLGVYGTYTFLAGGDSANSNISFTSGNINFTGTSTFNGNAVVTGNLSASNVTINTNGFVKLSTYTAAALTAITGQVGWMAAVTNSGGGGNPNGMLAFWDTTNGRWSYVHDNSAV